MRFRLVLTAVCLARVVPSPPTIGGQAVVPLSRAEAVRTALDRGARLGVARADTAVAGAQLLFARTLPNPNVSASYSKSVPQYHFTAEFPIDLPPLRNLRIRSAQVALEAAQLRFQFARAVVALDADTTYTHAIAARERLVLSRRNALDADSLLHMVERRRDAGDASDMDVELARVSAGREANTAMGDSLTWVSALLDLQAVLGMTNDGLQIQATDSLVMPPEAALPSKTLNEIAASAALESAALAERLQRRSVWSQPSVSLGFEYKDPDQAGLLPTFGLGIGLPLFNRNRGPIAQAEAERLRAEAELRLAQVEARNDIAHATRERENALARAARDQALVASANRVVSMSLTAYQEGASSLSNVLEAQRTARDVLSQYVDDLASAWIATAELRALAASASSTSRP